MWFVRYRCVSVLGLVGAMLAASGCGSDGESADAPGAGMDVADGGMAPADPADDGPGSGPLYLVHSAVQTTDARSNYFTVVDSIAEPREIDYADSLELTGRARLYAAEGIGFFAIGDSEGVTITRYELEDGSLVEGATISLQRHGVRTMGAQAVYFHDASKAYYKDADEAQIIVWNPTEMTVEEVIPLPERLVVDGWVTSVSDWAVRDGEAYFAVSWYTPEYDRARPGTALVRIDTETDEVTVTEDDRCRGIATAGHVDGTLYFFSGVINGFGHAVYPDDGGQEDCILRIQPGETAFDESYVGSLSGALPDDTAASAMALGADGRVWAQVADLTVAPTEPGASYGEWYAAGWTWWHTDLETLDAATQVDVEPGAYSGFTLATEGGFYISQTAADYSETTLVDLSEETPTPALSFPGFTLDVSRIR